jgi:hypothetical protein
VGHDVKGFPPASRIETLARRNLGSSAARRVLIDCAWLVSWLVALLALDLAVSMSGSYDRQLYYDAFSKPLYQDWGRAAMFLYSPAAAQLFWPATLIPLSVYLSLFGIAGCAAVAWMVAPLGWRWAPPAFLVVLPVTLHGGLEWVFALVAVLALRYPAVWAVPLLTKVTPGVGAFYYIGRRDWRSFGVAVGLSLTIALVSALFAPNLWLDWFAMLWAIIRDTGPNGFGAPLLPVPLLVRGLAALVIVLWGGSAGRPWTIVVAMILSRPDLGYSELAMLVALPRLLMGLEAVHGAAADSP